MNNILNDEVPILYELLVYEEWLQDPEIVKPQYTPLLTWLYSYLRHPEWPSEELTSASSSLLPWQVALSPNGLMVAILQEVLLEVRTQDDDFTSTNGKAIISKDAYPQLRILKWHPKNNKIAISSSEGAVSIFDTSCNHLLTLPPPSQDEYKYSPKPFVAGIEFIDLETRKKKEEILLVYSNGLIKSFTLSERGHLKENYWTQLSINQVSCAVYNKHFDILFVSSQPQPTTRYFQDSCFSAGLSAWRLISECPFYQRLFPSEEETKMLTAGAKLWKIFNYSKLQGVAVKLCVSQNNQFLASLHACNTIIIWLIPSLRMYRKWSMDYNLPIRGMREEDKAPVDIGWRHDEKLIVSRKDGSISVHHIETFEVCYGSGSALLSGYPRISSNENFPGFITLECDTILLSPSSEDSVLDCEQSILDVSTEVIQSTIYYITDIETFLPKKKSIKMIQKVYRMIGVKSTTPEELFWRKLDSNEYAGALELADEFGLNSDEVYKKLWRTSVVSASTISEYLNKVKNESWVLNECIQRVPESFSGVEDLLKFGFNITSKSSTFDDSTFSKNVSEELWFNCDSLTPSQKEKIVTRLLLLEYEEKLKAYNEILGGNPDSGGTYNMVVYDRFRKLPIVESAIYFARECNIRAVEVIFKYYTSKVAPYWFKILENIPEIFSPSDYQKLLPECDEQGNPIYWEDLHVPYLDWAHARVFRPLIPPAVEGTIVNQLEPVLTISGAMLSNWYCKRALEIESRSKLLHYAQMLVRIGIEKNIPGLDDLNLNFITLECMVYELELDIDTHAFLNMTDLQKSITMMEKTVPEDFIFKMLKYFVPFVNRHCMDNERNYKLFLGFLTYTSQENLKSSLLFISYVLDENYDLIGGPEEITPLIIECIYNYSRLDMVLETIEVIDSCIAWIRSQPKGPSAHQDLLKSLNVLRDETITAQIITTHQIPTTVKSINLLKLSEDEPKRIFEQMTSSAMKEYFKTKSMSKITNCLHDILSIQEVCFRNVRLDACYEMYASSLLNSGSLQLIELSNSVLCSKREAETSSFLSFDHSTRLVLHAAQRYFDNSESVRDDSMTLAKACLFLIKDDQPDINVEIDLTHALRYLDEIGINLIPVQVRQSEDRMKLLNLCFDKNHQLYKKSHFVYKLGGKLRICGDDIVLRHNMITHKLAKVSLADDAVSFCSEFCVDLVSNNYGKGWETVFELLKKRTVEDHSLVKVFWCFCVIHAPTRYLNELIHVRDSVILQFEGVHLTEDTPMSVVNTPDSDTWDDYHLASSDSSHKLDDGSDAEPMPGYISPFFYSDHGDRTEYGLPKTQHIQHSVLKVHHITSEPSLFAFFEARSSLIEPWNIDSKLIELGAKYLNKDTLTALGYLLSTHNPLSCEDFFDKLPPVVFTQELAVYYYSICSLRSSSKRILKTPLEAVNDAATLEHTEFRSSIAKYAKKCESLNQAKSIKDENCGVNYKRFIEDESYKTDTIYGLAMSPDKLELSFELAKKNGIPLIDIAITHIDSLIIEDKVDDLIKTYSPDSELACVLKSSNNVIFNRFQSQFSRFDGTDYKKLKNFFKIIQCLGFECIIHDFTAKDHIKLLKRIESTVPGLDYIDLITKRKDLMSLLKPYLVQSVSVGNCVKFAKSLPKTLKVDVSSSMLYYEFSLHQFHTLCVGCKSLKQCSSLFETIYPSLAKLNPKELLEFVQHSVCDSKVIANLDYATRRQLLNSLLQWCYETNDLRSNDSSIVTFIQEKLERLNLVWNDEEEDISSSSTLKKYLCEVESSDTNDDPLDQNHYKFILEQAAQDSGLTKSEFQVLKRVISDLDHQGGYMETLLFHSRLSEDGDFSFDQALTVTPEKISDNNEKLNAIRNFCEKIVANCPKSLSTVSFGDELLADSGLTSDVLKYLFLPQTIDNNDATSSIDGPHFSKYDVAISMINGDLPTLTFQKLAQITMEAFQSSHSDKMFLVWLCFSFEQLNLQDQGDMILNNDLMADQLVQYLRSYPECAERIVPRLVLTNKFSDVASTLLSEGDTQTVHSLIKALNNNGMSAEAGTLTMSSSGIPASLKTFGSSLQQHESSLR